MVRKLGGPAELKVIPSLSVPRYSQMECEAGFEPKSSMLLNRYSETSVYEKLLHATFKIQEKVLIGFN